ncbi:MAG: hypothetical protein AVDCRST_MAG57-1647, partial [uncultured Blastococcus sp.]
CCGGTPLRKLAGGPGCGRDLTGPLYVGRSGRQPAARGRAKLVPHDRRRSQKDSLPPGTRTLAPGPCSGP